jgi:transposase
MSPGTCIEYRALREVNPEAARLAVLEYLKTNGGNKSDAAKAFGITRPVVYDILKKQAEGDLSDRSRAPKRQPNKTPEETEARVIAAKNKTRLGSKRLSIYLEKYEQLRVAAGTIRHIIRRNKAKLTYRVPSGRRQRGKREFVDWYSSKVFEVVQMDVKYIRDQKALSADQIAHLDRFDIPNFQWGAIDVNSRFKLIAFSRERTWTNGLCFYLWVVSFLRAHGVTARIVFTVDNGEEFGGRSWFKLRELRKLLSGFGCHVIQNRKGHPEENAHLERSHRTDDDEFYKLRVFDLRSDQDLIEQATNYIHYYNNFREHSSLDYQPPFAHLMHHSADIDHKLRFVQPLILDDVAVALGDWSGYNVLAQHRVWK